MIIKTCTQCGATQKEPLAWTVAAWFRTDGVRVSYKHRLCMGCVASRIAPLQVHSDNGEMTCPNCGIDTHDDYDAIYVSWVFKGVGQMQIEEPFCAPCAAIYRLWFEQGAEKLENRERLGEGLQTGPSPDALQLLAALGIEPRVWK